MAYWIIPGIVTPHVHVLLIAKVIVLIERATLSATTSSWSKWVGIKYLITYRIKDRHQTLPITTHYLAPLVDAKTID